MPLLIANNWQPTTTDQPSVAIRKPAIDIELVSLYSPLYSAEKIAAYCLVSLVWPERQTFQLASAQRKRKCDSSKLVLMSLSSLTMTIYRILWKCIRIFIAWSIQLNKKENIYRSKHESNKTHCGISALTEQGKEKLFKMLQSWMLGHSFEFAFRIFSDLFLVPRFLPTHAREINKKPKSKIEKQ